MTDIEKTETEGGVAEAAPTESQQVAADSPVGPVPNNNGAGKKSVDQNLTKVLGLIDPHAQVEALWKIAENEGPDHAVKVVEKMKEKQGTNYILDELQEELMAHKEELKKKGYLEDIN